MAAVCSLKSQFFDNVLRIALSHNSFSQMYNIHHMILSFKQFLF